MKKGVRVFFLVLGLLAFLLGLKGDSLKVQIVGVVLLSLGFLPKLSERIKG